MKKMLVVFVGLMALTLCVSCSTNSGQVEAQNDDANMITNLDAINQHDREIADYNPDDYDVILRDSDNWYLLLNHIGTRCNRTYTYRGSVYVRAGSTEYFRDAWMVYDDVTHTMSIGLISPFDSSDLLQYTMIYDTSVGGGYEFDGSYGWRDYPYGYYIHIDFVKGTLGSLQAVTTLSSFEFEEASVKSIPQTVD